MDAQKCQEKQQFKRLLVKRDVARDMFEYNPMKLDIITKIPSTEDITLYRCGDFIDLCRGPHIPHTGMVFFFLNSLLNVTGESFSYH